MASTLRYFVSAREAFGVEVARSRPWGTASILRSYRDWPEKRRLNETLKESFASVNDGRRSDVHRARCELWGN